MVSGLGYNARIAMIFQARSQMREAYGVEATKMMLKSLGANIVFAPKDYDDACAHARDHSGIAEPS